MTEAQIRQAHAALVERDECMVKMINSWPLPNASKDTRAEQESLKQTNKVRKIR